MKNSFRIPISLLLSLEAALLLSGCGQSQSPSSSQRESESSLNTIPAFHVSFSWPETLTQPAPLSIDPNPTRYELKSVKTGSSALVVDAISYKENPDGLDDWSVTAMDKARFFQNPSCDSFQHSHLFIQMDKTKQCALVHIKSGQVALAVVGYAQTFEGTDYPTAILLIPLQDRVLVFEPARPFSQFDAGAQAVADTFHAQHPDLDIQWGGKDFGAAADEITHFMQQQIAQPSAEIQERLSALETLADTVDVTQL